MKPPSTARTAGRSGGCGGACDASPLSCFLFRPRKSRERRRKCSHTNVSNTLVTRPSTPPAQTPQRSFRGTAAGTHLPSPTGSHTADHRAKQGRFGWGWYHYPRSVSHGSETLRGRDLKRQTLPLLGFGRVYTRRTQKAFGTAMRSCVSLSQGVAAPLGCVIFFPLSKLRLLRPIPETSFGFPDAPACAVPVQAASWLVPFRYGAVLGFSVLSLCLTPFLDFGDKKKAVNYSHSATSQRSDFRYLFFQTCWRRTVCQNRLRTAST